jgi:hypothetical protein
MKRAEKEKKIVCLSKKVKVKNGVLDRWRLTSWVWLDAAEMFRASEIWTAFT